MNGFPLPLDPRSLPQWLWCAVVVPMSLGAYWLLTFGQRSARLTVSDFQKSIEQLRVDVATRDARIGELERRLVDLDRELRFARDQIDHYRAHGAGDD